MAICGLIFMLSAVGMSLIGAGEAFKCHDCSNVSLADGTICLDPLYKEHIFSGCEPDQTCASVRHQFNNGSRSTIERHCFRSPFHYTPFVNGCVKYSFRDYTKEICYCNTDLCNQNEVWSVATNSPSSITCFYCDKTDDGCSDPFHVGPQTVNITCSSGFCFKHVNKKGSTIRSCSMEPSSFETPRSGCIDHHISRGLYVPATANCGCQTDFCNASVRTVKTDFVLVALSALFMLVFERTMSQ
ncbi:hypothetical protein BV898_09492 [Hypsibius exemplaris]|uniref:Protein quiver n=1 Tax=Hypsibius exemplaris TaxID=2072580 RepID=A0A1W0WMG2_HYPEX|nr:hypothetical protein BV898_09492 [Hypsibius exemplaris]